MRSEIRIIRLSLVISLKENKKLVHVHSMPNPLEDFLRTVVRGDSSNVLLRRKVSMDITGHKRVWVSKGEH